MGVDNDVVEESPYGHIRNISEDVNVSNEKPETKTERNGAKISDVVSKPGEYDAESPQRLHYPKSVLFIVSNEFCERFSFYGLRTILAIYLKNQLHFDSDTATVIYHVFIMFSYFFPLLGAIVADSWLGKFRTIFYLSVVYAIGNVVVSVSAVPDIGGAIPLTMVGLILIALGTGGIKPCVSAFGGDQFVLPQQEKQLKKFFSLFYFSINSGSLISTFLTPILREDVKCLDQDSCYTLAFGVPAALMIVSIIVFVFGKRWYKMKEPEGNVIVEVSKCIWHAMWKKSDTKREHWLDKADDRFSKQFISDIKAALRVLVLYLPLPIFWALYDQQGSRWTFQAARMNGQLGDFKLKPDQMQVVNPVLILLFIPLFEVIIYPVCAKCNFLKRPLQRIVFGGILASLAFVVSAVVETQLETTYPVLPGAEEAQLRLYNGLDCELIIKPGVLSQKEIKIEPLGLWNDLHLEMTGSKEYNIEIKQPDCLSISDTKMTLVAYEEEATAYAMLANGTWRQMRKENTDKSDDGDPTVMVIYSDASLSGNKDIVFWSRDDDGKAEEEELRLTVNATYPYANYTKISSNGYILKIDDVEVKNDLIFDQGGAYALVINKNGAGQMSANYTVVTEPNSVHMLWLIPQYVVITAGEVMFSITGLEFSFTQAPLSMKSLLQAMWLITVAIGNLVDVIVAASRIFSSQTYEFILFAALMIVDMMVFAYMAYRYKYVEDMHKDSNDNENMEMK